MLKTALAERLGRECPIVQAGVAWVTTWEFVVAVAQAGRARGRWRWQRAGSMGV